MTDSNERSKPSDWLTPDFYPKAYDRFIRLRWNIDPFHGEDLHLDPDHFQFSDDEMKRIPASPFTSHLLDLASRSLVGQINGFYDDLFALKAWEVILPDYEVTQRLHLFCEFVESRLSASLNAPYALKSQIAFTGAKVAILFERGRLHAKLPEDRDISFKDFQKWAGGWNGFDRVERALNLINDPGFASSTNKFRDRYHHRIPPRIEYGLTPVFSFERDGGRLTMRLSPEEPLPFATAIDASVTQHRACASAFREFWLMIKARIELL